MTIRQRSAALATAALLLAGLEVGVAPPSTSSPLPGTFETLMLSSSMRSWPPGSEPVTGTPAGTVFADGTTRPTGDPSSVLTLGPLAQWLVLADTDRLTGSPHQGASYLTGGSAVSRRTGDVDVLFWRLDPGTGALATRSANALPATTTYLGATATAWVTADGGVVAVWPFDGSNQAAWAPADMATPLDVSEDGLLYGARSDPTDTSAPDLLRLAPADASPVVTVAAGESVTTGGAFHVGFGTVAWTQQTPWGLHGPFYRWTRERGVESDPGGFHAGGSASPVPGGALLSRSVPKAGLVLTLWPWQPASPTTSLCGTSTWPSRTIVGEPAVGQACTTPEGLVRWSTVAVADGAATELVPGPSRLDEPLVQVAAGPGRLLTVGLTGVGVPSYGPQTTALHSWAVASGRAVLRSTTTSHYWRQPQFGYPAYERFGQATLAVSGPYSAIVDASREPTLVIRRDSTVTGRWPSWAQTSPSWPQPVVVSSRTVSVSGPYVVGDDAAGALRWSGPDGRPRLVDQGVTSYAVDGSRVAYAKGSTVLVRDVARPVSSSNPRRITDVTGVEAVQALTGRVLMLYRLVRGSFYLSAVDVATGARHTVRAPASCAGLVGAVAVCRDDAGRVVTWDMTRSSTFTATRLSVPLDRQLAVVGDLIAWSSDRLDPATGLSTTLLIASAPTGSAPVGHPRLLGPWARYGAVTSNAASTFCWRPEWSLSLPTSSWRLTLRNRGGSTVRTWTGSGADAALRGVTWCPGTAPAGTYGWTLTGSGPHGGPVSVSGTGAATGTVTVVRQKATSLALAAPGLATRGAPVTLAATLTAKATGRPLPSRAVTLWKRLDGVWVSVRTAATGSTGRATFRVTLDRSTTYQVRHAADPATGASVSTSRSVRAI